MPKLPNYLTKVVLGRVTFFGNIRFGDADAGIDGTCHQYPHRQIRPYRQAHCFTVFFPNYVRLSVTLYAPIRFKIDQDHTLLQVFACFVQFAGILTA
ncbi:MAG: hypothetical protein WAU86_07350 [Oricola sp.]